jgi:hypothetical protein
VAAIGATLPGAAWQRCRTHYTTNLMTTTPNSSWPWVRTLLHSIFDQPDAESVVAQYDLVPGAVGDKLPKVAEHLDAARAVSARGVPYANTDCDADHARDRRRDPPDPLAVVMGWRPAQRNRLLSRGPRLA